MSGAGGKWMVSSVTDGDIKKLRGAEYLAVDIAHRLPAAGQIVPTPEPYKRAVFLTHFVHGLGFPLIHSSAALCSIMGWTSMI